MIHMICGVVIGLCLFIVPLWAYRRGLKDGLALNQGKPIEPIKTPVQAVTEAIERRHEAKEAKEESDRISQGLANLLAYDGSPQEVVE